MMITKASPLKVSELWQSVRGIFLHHHHGAGLYFLMAVLVLLSLLSSMQWRQHSGVFLAGDIASHEVVADRNLLVEDTASTQVRREQALTVQPKVFDLSLEGMDRFRQEVISLLLSLNSSQDEKSLAAVSQEFNSRYNANFGENVFQLLSLVPVQQYITTSALPFLEGYLAEGVLADTRQLASSQSSLLVRDGKKGDVLRQQHSGGILDLRSLALLLGQELRSADSLRPIEKSVVLEILPMFLQPTLAFNQSATEQKNIETLRGVEPVLYRVQKGEVVVRAGDIVSLEQQIKMQALYKQSPGFLDFYQFFGSVVLSFLLMAGLFITPSSTKGTVLQRKDLFFIALLLLFFGMFALGLQQLFLSLGNGLSYLPFFFPVAGAAGLSALIFAARRYCCIGLLLAFYTSQFFHSSLFSFLFFFLTAMFATFLVLRAQNRQDVVWSGLPLFLWLLVSGLPLASLEHMDLWGWPILVGVLALNALTSLALLFAMSPILEMSLGYTTRFRLMELMNLEQPLLQAMMINTPGTYHHSLVVSNLVESGAKAVGANSLLCKVGALYHDIGKLAYPNYFIENQFGGPNPHDKLSPAMSALILSAHVKKGSEFAESHRLGEEINDIIRQHHGVRSMLYFYKKALDAGENPREEDFSYPGPRPQNREAAIIMVADVLEASSRTLTDPTPARICSHVDTIIKNIYAEGQLDESDLTFRDLHKLSESFSRTLTGLFHQRIAYPDKKPAHHENGAEAKTHAEEARKQAEAGDAQQSHAQRQGKMEAHPEKSTDKCAGKCPNQGAEKREEVGALTEHVDEA